MAAAWCCLMYVHVCLCGQREALLASASASAAAVVAAKVVRKKCGEDEDQELRDVAVASCECRVLGSIDCCALVSVRLRLTASLLRGRLPAWLISNLPPLAALRHWTPRWPTRF